MDRRDFLRTTATLAAAGAAWAAGKAEASEPVPGERPPSVQGARVLNPRTRTPISMIIDDSTCLVNLAHFGMPQFAEVWPDEASYQKPWRKMPREIPDDFVRKFGEWCGERGVKGKYSIVPYPACVGWVDRRLPGWSRRELDQSLELVRALMTPNWDIHPEMISHTCVIDTKTGRPYEERSARFMENWQWTDGKSVDELANYMAYALRILKNVGLPCEGITTPGGFGNRVLAELAQATLESVRDVYGAEVPHYFRHLYTDKQSVAPRVEYASDIGGASPRCVVSIIGCTGDWFGGWDGMTPGSVDQFITRDLKQGRMVDVLERGEPAIMVCHWPGIYFNGEETGFKIFQEVVRRLSEAYDNLIWMKLGEISRYWAAKELTRMQVEAEAVRFDAPFANPGHTLFVETSPEAAPRPVVETESTAGRGVALREVANPLALEPGTWTRDPKGMIACFDLPKGASRLVKKA